MTHLTGQKDFAKNLCYRRVFGMKWRSLAKYSSAEIILRQQPTLNNLYQCNGE
jgi:hypothetical protein